MRILLVNATPRLKGTPYIFPIQLAVLGSALVGEGHDVRAVDMLGPGDPERLLAGFLREGPYDMIGVSYRNVPYAYWRTGFAHLQRMIVRLRPHAPFLVVGGAGFSLFHDLIMREVPEIEAGAVGEGEQIITRLAANPSSYKEVPGVCWREAGRIRLNPRGPHLAGEKIPPLREVPGIVWAGYESVAVQSYRGCLKTCNNCTMPYLRGTAVRMRDLDAVLRDISFLTVRGVKSVHFIDGKFNLFEDRARRLIDGVRASFPGLLWAGFLRPSPDLPADFLEAARGSGCRLWHIEPDSGDDLMLRRLHGDVDRAGLLHTVDLLSALRIRARYYFTYCLPGESIRQELNTIRMLGYLLSKGVAFHDMMIFPYFPYPNLGFEGSDWVVRVGKRWHIERMLKSATRPSLPLYVTTILAAAGSPGVES